MKPMECCKCPNLGIFTTLVISTAKAIRYVSTQGSVIISSTCIGSYFSRYWISKNCIYDKRVSATSKGWIFNRVAFPFQYSLSLLSPFFIKASHPFPGPILISIPCPHRHEDGYGKRNDMGIKGNSWNHRMLGLAGTWEIISLTSSFGISESLGSERQSDFRSHNI